MTPLVLRSRVSPKGKVAPTPTYRSCWFRDQHGGERYRPYTWVHDQLRKMYRKPSVCWLCGEHVEKVEWALRPDRTAYTLDIADYLATCKPCHSKMDHGHEVCIAWPVCREAA